MKRSFVFPWKEMVLVSNPGDQLQLRSPGSTNAALIVESTKTDTVWNGGIITALDTRYIDGEWTFRNDILRVGSFIEDPACPVFSTESDQLVELLLRLGATEIEYRDPTPPVVWKIEVFDTSGDVAGWFEPLLEEYKYLGVPL